MYLVRKNFRFIFSFKNKKSFKNLKMYIGIKFKYFTIYLYLDLILIVPATCTFDEIEDCLNWTVG